MRDSSRKIVSSRRGVAALEAALVLVVFLPLVLQGAALFDYLVSSSMLERRLEEAFQDTKVKPLLLREEAGRAHFRLNEDSINSYLERLSEQIRAAVAQAAPRHANFRLSLTVYEASVDAATGEVRALIPRPPRHTGGFEPPAEDSRFPPSILTKDSLPFRGGVPAAAGLQGQDGYLPAAVVLNADLIVDMRREVSGQIAALAGRELFIRATKAYMLRGEVQ